MEDGQLKWIYFGFIFGNLSDSMRLKRAAPKWNYLGSIIGNLSEILRSTEAEPKWNHIGSIIGNLPETMRVPYGTLARPSGVCCGT